MIVNITYLNSATTVSAWSQPCMSSGQSCCCSSDIHGNSSLFGLCCRSRMHWWLTQFSLKRSSLGGGYSETRTVRARSTSGKSRKRWRGRMHRLLRRYRPSLATYGMLPWKRLARHVLPPPSNVIGLIDPGGRHRRKDSPADAVHPYP